MADALRVLLLAEGFPPDPGGVATSTRRIAGALIDAGAKLQVLTYLRTDLTDLGQPPLSSIVGGIPVIRIGPFFKTSGSLHSEQLNEKQKAQFRRRFVDSSVRHLRATGFMPDVVLSLYLINAGFLATFIAAELGIPHAAGVRGSDIGRNVFDPTLLFATKFVLDSADKIVSVNEHLRKRMLSVFPHLEQKATVIPNSIAIAGENDRRAARERLLSESGWPPDSLILCFIGAFREKKGCVDVLAAMERLKDLPVKLVVVAPPLSSTERAVVGPQFDALKRDGVILHTGLLAREEVRPLCAGSDIVLLPALDDGMANGVLEGMAEGLCPVVSEVFKDLIRDGETGAIVPTGDVDALVACIAGLERRRDRVLSMGAAARQYVRRWTPSAEAKAYLGTLSSIVDARAGGRPGRIQAASE